MKNLLLTCLICITQLAMAQYCGYSGANICSTTGGLSSTGITDYHTVPCVHDNVPFSQVVQIYFPDSASISGQTLVLQSFQIDSITNLPCGLCWSCNDSTLTYAGGSRACILLSGTTTDAPGTYQTNIYVTINNAYTATLDLAGLQFFLHVIGQNDSCTPINISTLSIACSTPVAATCHFNVQLTGTPVTNCMYDSMTVSIANALPGYHYVWQSFNFNTFPFAVIDSTSTSFTFHSGDLLDFLTVRDSAGCTDSISLLPAAHSGLCALPNICYITTDSSDASGSVRVLYERDDYFGNIASYIVQRQDTSNQLSPLDVVGVSPAAVGYVLDSTPSVSGLNYYSVELATVCGDTISNANGYTRSILAVDTASLAAMGYPFLSWTNSSPLNYNTIYVFSRNHAGHWDLRYSSDNLINNTFWVDMHPDSTHMEYMLGYNLTTTCDPTRSGAHTAFSNFSSINITPDKVTPDSTTSPLAISAISAGSAIIYPNPVNDKVYIQLAQTGNADMTVYDVQGRILMNKTLTGTAVSEINVQNLATGIYTIRIIQDNNLTTIKKIVKE